jgi:hypothetical protein
VVGLFWGEGGVWVWEEVEGVDKDVSREDGR